MAVESVHARKVLLAALAWERSDIEVQLFMPLAIVLSCEPFPAPRPLALVRFLFRMRPQMSCTQK